MLQGGRRAAVTHQESDPLVNFPGPSRTLLNHLESYLWLPPRDSNPDMLIQSQLSYH